MKKHKKYTDEELKGRMTLAIEKMVGVLEDEDDAHKKVQAANALSGLVKRYKELFKDSHSEGEAKLRSVKNF